MSGEDQVRGRLLHAFEILAADIVHLGAGNVAGEEHQWQLAALYVGDRLRACPRRGAQDQAVDIVLSKGLDQFRLPRRGFLRVAEQDHTAVPRHLVLNRRHDLREIRVGHVVDDDPDGLGRGRAQARRAAVVHVPQTLRGFLDAQARAFGNRAVSAQRE